jgi:hypothetical protein
MCDYLPKKTGDVELKVMKEMFEASVDVEAFDMNRWGQYFRPAGMSSKTGDPVAPTAVTPEPDDEPVSAPVNAAVSAPKAEAKPASGGNAQDILAMIRSRQNNG